MLFAKKVWPWVLGVGGGLVGVLAVVGFAFAREALSVRDDLLAAKENVGQIASYATTGDVDGLQRSADEALVRTTRAEKTASGPLWQVAARVPFVGQNISAVQSATEATHILVRDAVPIAVKLLETINPDSLKVAGGGINLAPFEQAQAELPAINAAFHDAKAKIDPIELDALHPVVSDALAQLVDVVDQAAPALELVEKYLPTLLQMLGKDEPREYMIVFQTNAEIRATGGNSTNFVVMSIDNGKIEMREDWVAAQAALMGVSGVRYAELPDETLALYEYDFPSQTQNYTRTPDFPTTARLFDGLWMAASGEQLDGIISLDIPTLAKLLGATGPVTLDDGEQITADNAVPLLLFDVYERFGLDSDASGAYFANVAATAFEAISSGKWAPTAMIDALGWGAEQQRIYAWFQRDGEQSVARELGIDGALSADNDEKTQLGIYVNDASYSKLEYFYSQEVAVTCDLDEGTMVTTITMHNSITDPNLNAYTLAWRNASLGVPRTTMILDVMMFAPPGAEIINSDPTVGDFSDWGRAGEQSGHAVKSLTMLVPMGESRTVSFETSIPDGELGPLFVRHSPAVGETPVNVSDSCGAL